jgi:multiple sugar transport system ATP-binding protein
MAVLELKQIRKSFGAVEAIRGVDLTITDREFAVFVGPSGCGKSTLLRVIAGLESATSGDLLIDGRRVNDVAPDKRGLAMVFQSYALYPHMSVAGNLGFALRLAGVPRAERKAKVLAAARTLQLDHLLDRKPKQLSGGQRQRVAIGRAIVREPKAFLFDEPLSNLDAGLRVQMRLELVQLHRRLGATTIYVTHDQVEAMTMADRIVVLNGGVIEQAGTPLELYANPRNLFVAGFIGSPKMNMLNVTVAAVTEHGAEVALPGGGSFRAGFPPKALASGARATLGLRPEVLAITDEGPLGGEVKVLEHLGDETLIYVDIGDGTLVTVKSAADDPTRVGDRVRLTIKDPGKVRLFDAAGQAVAPASTR